MKHCPFGPDFMVSPNGFRSYGSVCMPGLNLRMCAMMRKHFSICAGASLSCAPESLPKAEEFGSAGLRASLKLHKQRPREVWDVQSNPVEGRAVSLCYMAKRTLPGGDFGLRCPLPGARPAQGHKITNAERLFPPPTDRRSVELIPKDEVFRSFHTFVKVWLSSADGLKVRRC